MPPTTSAFDVVEVLAHAEALRPRHGDHEADEVADDDEDEAEVEQRRADPQQPRLVQLRGARGPAELVVAVAPDRAADEQRQHDVREDSPQQHVHREASRARAAAAAGRRRRARPPRGEARRRPSGARPRRRPAMPGQRVADRLDDPGVRGADVAERELEQLEAGPVLLQQDRSVDRVGDRGVLQHHRQVVGQLTVGVDEPAARPVARLERGRGPHRGAGCRRRSSTTGTARASWSCRTPRRTPAGGFRRRCRRPVVEQRRRTASAGRRRQRSGRPPAAAGSRSMQLVGRGSRATAPATWWTSRSLIGVARLARRRGRATAHVVHPGEQPDRDADAVPVEQVDPAAHRLRRTRCPRRSAGA